MYATVIKNKLFFPFVFPFLMKVALRIGAWIEPSRRFRIAVVYQLVAINDLFIHYSIGISVPQELLILFMKRIVHSHHNMTSTKAPIRRFYYFQDVSTLFYSGAEIASAANSSRELTAMKQLACLLSTASTARIFLWTWANWPEFRGNNCPRAFYCPRFL